MKNKLMLLVLLIGGLVFLGMPTHTLNATFENDTREIQWLSGFDDRVSGDHGGIFEDSIVTSQNKIIAAGLHTDVNNPNDPTVNHYNGLIASYDMDGNILKSLEMQHVNNAKSFYSRVIELSNGNFVAVGLNHWDTNKQSGKIVVFDSNLNVINSKDYQTAIPNYESVSFVDVVETSRGLHVVGTITTTDEIITDMGSFIFDLNLNVVEEVVHESGITGSTIANMNRIVELGGGKSIVLGNHYTGNSSEFLLTPFTSGSVDQGFDVVNSPRYSGYAADAIANPNGTIAVLVVLDNGTHQLKQFDASMNPINDVAINFENATYSNVTLHNDNTYVVSGDKGGFMHYLISNGQTTSSHTFDQEGTLENTLSLGDDALLSVGYRFSDFHATVMKTLPEYTVTFDGGTEPLVIPSQEILKGNTVTQPANPSSLSGTFMGWFSDVALTTPYDFSSPVNESMTLYAKWGIIEMTLEHDGNIDLALAPEDSVNWINFTVTDEIFWDTFALQIGAEPAITPLGQARGVKFEGWNLVGGTHQGLLQSGDIIDETMVDLTQFPYGGTLTVKAVYSRPSYTVSILDTENSQAKDYTIFHGELLDTLNHTPVNDGYIFTGYTDVSTGMNFDATQAIVRDVTLVGNWTKVSAPLQNLETKLTWVGGSDPRPSVTVDLFANNVKVDSKVVETGTTSITWTDLAINDDNGVAIQYSIKAVTSDEYEVSYQDLNLTLSFITKETPKPPVKPDTPKPPVKPDTPKPPVKPDAPKPPVTPDTPQKNEVKPTLPNNNGRPTETLPSTGVSNNSLFSVYMIVLGGVLIAIRKSKKRGL